MKSIPDGFKIVYDKLDFSIAIGDTSHSETKQLRQGECVGVKLIDYSSATDRANAINIALNDTNGSALVGTTDFRDFIAIGGSYVEGYKPAEFSTNPSISIGITSTKVIADADFNGQLIFAIMVKAGSSN